MRLMLAVVAAAALAPAAAREKCPSPVQDLCSQPEQLVEALVVSVDQGRTRFDVEAVHHPADGGVTGTLTLPSYEGEAAGQRRLLYLEGANSYVRVPVESDGRVRLQGTSVVRMSRSEFLQAALSPDCAQTLREAGLEEPPCSEPGPFGCSSTGALGVPVLGLLAGLLVRRKRSATGS